MARRLKLILIFVFDFPGQTPNKRDYQYPKDLAATQPHSLIVRRFWDEYDGSPLDCSGVISEVCKSQGFCAQKNVMCRFYSPKLS